MFKKIAFAGVGIALLASPLISSADTLSDMQAQIQALLVRIAALQAQATQTSPILPPVVTDRPDDYGTGVAAPNYCPKLSVTMQKGSRDATTGRQVGELQAFLTDYFNLDENIVVGGYFGNLTHKYVVQFQSEQGLPSFGIAGQLTRAKIAQVCGGGTVAVPSLPPQPKICPIALRAACPTGQHYETAGPDTVDSRGCRFASLKCVPDSTATLSASPTSGPAPLTVTFSGVTGSSISYGDGVTSGIMDGTYESVGGRVTYTYQKAGTYTATNNGKSVTVMVTGVSDSATLYLSKGTHTFSPIFNVSQDLAQRICNAVPIPGVQCAWNGKTLIGQGVKDGGPYIRVIKPIATDYVGRSKNSGFSFSDPTAPASDPNALSSTYRIFYVRYINNSTVGEVYELPLTVSGRSGTEIYGYVDTASIPNGNYYPGIINVSSAVAGSVGAYVFLTGSAEPTGSITVTSPNGGESIAANAATQVKIAWRMDGISTPISIALYKNDAWLYWIETNLRLDKSPDGTYSYTWVPNAKGPALPDLSGGNNSGFKIYITGPRADGMGYVDDKSNAPFGFVGFGTPRISISPSAGSLQNGTLWVETVVSNYSPQGNEIVDFGDGSRYALGYTTAFNNRHDYHSPGTYTVKLLNGSGSILATATITIASVPPQSTVNERCTGFTFTKDLRLGANDGQVVNIRDFLNIPDSGIGSQYDETVSRYVDIFQRKYSLPVGEVNAGVWDAITRAKANAINVQCQPSQTIRVTAPNGGEQWEEGVLNTVTWTPYQYNPDINPARDVTAYLERFLGEKENGEKVFETIGKVQESGKASIHWITGELNSESCSGPNPCQRFAPDGENYYIRVVNNVTGTTDRSDAPFRLLPKPVDLQINGSDGPVSLTENQQVQVSWRSKGTKSCFLSGGLKNAQGDAMWTQNMTTSGLVTAYFTTIGGVNSIVLNCVRLDGTYVNDFVLVNPVAAQASLRITSPNGGEQFNPNESMTVSALATGIANYSIALYKNDQWVAWVVKDVLPTGVGQILQRFLPWDIGRNLAEGDNAGAKWKIYITGQKADGTGYVDDKSDAPFGFTGGTTGAGTLTVSTDSSTPGYQIVAGGSTGVTMSAATFRASGEAVTIREINVNVLTGAGYPSKGADIVQIYLYNTSGQMIGSGVFAGNSSNAWITPVNPLVVPKDSALTVIVKADIASIGTAQPGTPGNLLKVMALSAIGTGASSGLTINANNSSSPDSISGVRIFKSYPTVAQVSLPSNGLADGGLLRFAVTANQNGDIGIGKMEFWVNAVGPTLGDALLGVYADAGYSQSITSASATIGGGNTGTGSVNVVATPPFPIQIPAGQTRYFELRAKISGSQGSVTTTLPGSGQFQSLSALAAIPSQWGPIWSPNDYGISQFSDPDWTNGYGVKGLPASGISQTRTGGTVTPTETRGTYKGYLNGNLFITTSDISPTDALANCKLNASNNRDSSIRCTWNEIEIYNSATGVGASATTPNPNLANALTALESALKALIAKLGQ